MQLRSKRLPSSYFKERILEVITNAELPLDIDNVRRKASLANWESTKSLLLELVLEGKVRAFRSSKGWLFFSNTWDPTVQMQQLRPGSSDRAAASS